MIRMHKKIPITNMDECIYKLFQSIYNATYKSSSISGTAAIGLISPLVKAAIENKNEPAIDRLDDLIQIQGEKFITKLKCERIEDEMEFQKFQKRFTFDQYCIIIMNVSRPI